MDDKSNHDAGDAPPSYDSIAQHMNMMSNATDDGRIEVDLNTRLSRTLSLVFPLPPPSYIDDAPKFSQPGKDHIADLPEFSLRLNVVLQVVGSRGDVQPFVALAAELQKHGHRVRLATHNVFKSFVQESNIEFYPIGGDPSELMAYMVKNPGLIPSMRSLREGDIGQKRDMISQILRGCWKSCIEPDPDSGEPFVADAIIANPPSFAHVHCAEALGIPVHLMFTMPWSPTRDFSHPLANLKGAMTDAATANYLSYAIVAFMTWQGLGDIINAWRKKLDLRPVPNLEAPMMVEGLKVPFTYCWSPSLIPKPRDWPEHIDVCGFFFRDPPSYTPPPDLAQFLKNGPPPIYIGFGSIVLENANQMSTLLLQAVRACGARAIISRGWSYLDGPEDPEIFWLEDCPHEWLFQHVSAVIHHGGAGTTACGLLNARPTVIVPFFGDQPFWGEMVASAGAGPKPIPHKNLTVENLIDAIQYCFTLEAQNSAHILGSRMRTENGVESAVRSFHRNLPLDRLACDLLPHQAAVWKAKCGKHAMKLSKLAAEWLTDNPETNLKNLRVYKPKKISIEHRRWDPVTGATAAALAAGADVVHGLSGIVWQPGMEIYRRGRDQASSHSTGSRLEVPSSQGIDSERLSTRSDASSISSHSATESSNVRRSRSPFRSIGAIGAASGKSAGRGVSSFARGIFVDVPLATAEGFQALPKLWGEEVKDYGRVSNFTSGTLVAGKSLVLGISDGVRDVVRLPVVGAREGGFLGATKGVAKGGASLVTKTLSGSIGVLAYPGQGLTKTIHAATHSSIQKDITEKRRKEGRWLLVNASPQVKESIATALYNRMLRRTS